MKTWTNAELVELNIGETAQGGKNLNNVDNYWNDTNTGELYASYASGSGERPETDDFEAQNKQQ